MKKIIFFTAILCLVFFPLKAQDYWHTEILSVEKNQGTMKKLLEMNLDFLMERNNRVYIIVSFDDFLKLEKENIPYALETFNFYPYKQMEVSLQGGVNGQYHSYGELERDLLALQDSYPHIAKVLDIGDSLEGRNIYALKISDNVHVEEEEAEVLFIGCHHAREWISVEVPFLLGKYLIENYEINSQVRDLVDQSEIWIIPLLNPDGLEYSINFYRYWRKNRRDNGDGSYGVDPNRNYGYNWGLDNVGSSPSPASQVYRGTSPFSEPETQVIRDLFAGKNFQAVITYHSYSQVILYPWGFTDKPTNEDQLLDQIAADMSTLIQSVNGNFYDYYQAGESFYLTNGDTTDWTFGTYGIPSYTIELPPKDELHGGFFNAEEDIQPIFNENLPPSLYLIEWSIQNFNSNTDFRLRIERRPRERVKLKNKILFGREARNERDGEVKMQSSKLKTEDGKTSDVKSKRTNVTRLPQKTVTEHEHTNRLTKGIKKYMK